MEAFSILRQAQTSLPAPFPSCAFLVRRSRPLRVPRHVGRNADPLLSSLTTHPSPMREERCPTVAHTFAIHHPESREYTMTRAGMLDAAKGLKPHELEAKLRYEMQQPRPTATQDQFDLTQRMLGEMRGSRMIPDAVKAILDSTNTTTGNALIRQDLEPLLYQLFVTRFPAWERLRKKPANGLTHAFNQITAAASGSSLFGTVLATELTNVAAARSNFVQKTAPVSVFATLRGASFKELAAVRQGGVAYDVLGTELADGMVNLATDAQAMIMQGNSSNSGGTSSNEGGPYSTTYFDGWRGVLGSYSSFSANNAIQVDWGGVTMVEGLQNVASQSVNNGGRPTAIYLPINSKQALDVELQSQKRYTDDTVEIVAGVRVNKISFADGDLVVIPVPGTTIGSYARTSDGVQVEDCYVIDEAVNSIVWLYSEGWTVLEIPAGVDTQLSNRYIVFGMYGFEQ